MPLLAPWTQDKATFAAAIAAIPNGTTVYSNGLISRNATGIDGVTPDGRWTWNLTTHDGTLAAPDRVEVWHSVGGAVPTKAAVLSATGTPLTTVPAASTAAAVLGGAGVYAAKQSIMIGRPADLGQLMARSLAVLVGDGGGTSEGSVAVGWYALRNVQAAGTSNTAVGSQAGHAITTGTTNVFIGMRGGTAYQGIGADVTTGNRNVCVGSGATTATSDTSDAVAIGYQAYAAANTVQLLANKTASGAGKVFVGPDRLVTLTELKAVVASATDFNDFKTKIAALS
jgi:hypothetical protein